MGEKLQFTELDQYLFGQGTHYDIYRKLGAHPVKQGKKEGVYFAVWAPNAQAVSVIGEFNDWNEQAAPMKKAGPIGVFETFVPGAKIGQLYKFFIVGMNGEHIYKADPYANEAELRPGTASRITDIGDYKWKDTTWMKNRQKFDETKDAMAIYEVHPGSWMKHPATEENEKGFFNYRELAVKLAQYVKDMGYTHVELMGIAEHPFDGSWGYQVTGYYAPTSRYGTPKDFMKFVDICHSAGIGVILDWVGAHFPKDETGLYEFDGGCCYEPSDPLRKEHPDWGTHIFDYGRYEVRSFLISNVVYWLDMYHVDGIRVDAVASMLYLDYGRRDGQWRPNQYGGNTNLDAVKFLQDMSAAAFEFNPGALVIAEESTAFPMVTKPGYDGGLGFNFKWNMGWMHDMLDYMSTDPLFRKGRHNNITFSLTYAFSENFILPLSHDEVVHGKCSLLNKMPGDYEEKFQNLRAFYGYMMTHPGKKLVFMGGEFGQFIEWDFTKELDWFLLEYDKHRQLQDYVRDLNHFYLAHPALWQNDNDWHGFQWIACDDNSQSVISFRRVDAKGKEVVVVCNFCPVTREHYCIGAAKAGTYIPVLSSDDVKYGGTGTPLKPVKAKAKPMHGLKYSIELTLPPLSTVYYEREAPQRTRKTVEGVPSAKVKKTRVSKKQSAGKKASK